MNCYQIGRADSLIRFYGHCS